jgi:protein-S-isoprenylcysteine O-methyltransferase Ste14
MNIPRLLLTAQLVLLVVTMAIRRPPVRITTNISFWITAFVATYWGFLAATWFGPGARVAPTVVTNGLALGAVTLGIASRLSLGRNIGFVPAQRRLVMTGAYKIVRHPIYTGIILGIISLSLQSCSVRNVIIDIAGCLLFMLKSLQEEQFLAQDPEYAAYMKKVRWRWIPSIA